MNTYVRIFARPRDAPLVWSICVRYRLGREETDDVGQTVWLLLVEKIGNLREPAALPGWLATTTQRECLRVLRAARRHGHKELPREDQMPPDPDATMIEEELLAAERGAAIRAAFAELPRGCRELLSMLVSEAVPAEFVEAGRNVFAWHNIDGELAQLAHDSLHGSPDLAASTRSEPASVRSLTFTSPQLTIELEVTADSLLGQIVPIQVATIGLQTQADAETVITSDEIGCFSVYPMPHGPFRLRCRTAAGVDVLTSWITH